MDPSARIIDASFNRAREGLRVMEDLARFALDDRPATESLKQLRHALAQAVSALPIGPAALVGARDVPGDVGTAVTTASERTRRGRVDVCKAAAARAGEALRSLEETAKTTGAAGSGFERLRYRVYDLEKRLLERLLATGDQWRLCVLLTESRCAHHPWLDVARRAIDGGADCIQLREKTLESGALLDRARRLVEIGRRAGVAVIINDRADIATLSGADGVHVGQSDLSVDDARRIAGRGALVGVSTARPEQARAAVAAGASYCGLGPMFASTTKAKPERAGPGYLRAYLADPATRAIPHLAISGITPDNAGRLASAGCRGIAVSAAVCGAADPADACRRLLAAMHAPA